MAPEPATAEARRAVRRLLRQIESALDRQGIRRAARPERGPSEPHRLLVAVSGGIDSMVLLHALARLAPVRGLCLRAGHVHHGLRGAAADADEAAARQLAEKLGLGFDSARVDPPALRAGGSSRSRPTLQEAARRLRYAELEEMARGMGTGARIATAHQADDQAETVMLRVLRGSGPDGLAGIPETSPDGRRIRPLLGCTRGEIERYAAAEGVPWREDESNASDAYARNRLRNHWLPALARDFNPRLLRTLGQLAEAHHRDAEWIESLVAQEAGRRVAAHPEGDGLVIAREGWSELPESLARRVLRRAVIELGGGRDLTRTHLARMQRFADHGRPGAVLELPGGLQMTASAAALRLRRVRVEPEPRC